MLAVIAFTRKQLGSMLDGRLAAGCCRSEGCAASDLQSCRQSQAKQAQGVGYLGVPAMRQAVPAKPVRELQCKAGQT